MSTTTTTEAVNSAASSQTVIDKTVCTDDDVKDLVMKATVTTYSERTGLFIFTHTGKEKDGTRERYEIRLVRDSGELVKSMGALLSSNAPRGVLVVDNNLLLVLFQKSAACFIQGTDSWADLSVINDKNELFFSCLRNITGSLLQLNHTSNLSKVRLNGVHDFTIICDEGEIQVQSLILSSQWPFFKNMLDSKMSESETHTLRLRYPVTWVEALVSHFYDERKPLDFDTATGVIIVAQIYDVPELLTQAMRRIKREEMTIHQALVAWKRANSVENKAVRSYCANRVSELIAKLSSSAISQELLNDLTQLEFVQLFNDLSVSAETKEIETKKVEAVETPVT